jgi:H/ACA ribonucleoprotein complex subunit 4
MGTDIYLRSKESTDPDYGSDPRMRSIEELLKTGVINLDKPRGPTSHQVVSWVKRVLGVEKAGHGGTLDPKVSGVLPVALERSTRVINYLLKSVKTYTVVMTLHDDIGRDAVDGVLDSFRGTILQTPPIKSAVKREPRERMIYRIEFLEMDGRDVLFEAECEAGTYVRKLCRDMGEALLSGANMSELRRIRSGIFDEEGSCTLQDLVDAMFYFREEGNEVELRRLVRPVEDFVKDFPKIWVRDTAVEALCNGADLALPGVVKCQGGIEIDSEVAVMTLKDELVGIGKSRMSARKIFEGESGIAAELSRIVMERGLYPRYWK